ncbi:hypothetical protein WJX79_009917 [Trebouxia sp. C0005]
MMCDFAQSKLPNAYACLQRPCLYAHRPAKSLRSQRSQLHSASSRFLTRGSPAFHPWSRCNSSLLDQAWGTHINAQELATNIFSTSIIPYSAFLYYLTKSKKTPPLALFGFYFLLVFVFATIPAGIIALKVYHKSLANVDWLHGSAESMLTVTNLLIVLGLRQGVRQAEQGAANKQISQAEETSQAKSADTAQ